MFKIYLGNDYPDKYGVKAVEQSLAENAILVDDPAQADLFVFPVLYEILFEYSDLEYQNASFTKIEIEDLKAKLDAMVSNAVLYNKKIIVFYYRDPVKKLDIKNAVVFRTSLVSTNRDNEYALPAYVKDIKQNRESGDVDPLPKTPVPLVGFRGQSAPLNLPAKTQVKLQINKLLRLTGVKRQINLYYNFGYLARRAAALACLTNKKIKADITITTAQESLDPVNGKRLFF